VGDIGRESSEEKIVEYTSLYIAFEEFCPFYMSLGMTYNEYWNEDPTIVKFYRECDKLKNKRIDEQLWMQGMYIYEALCDVSPILHAFSKGGTKPLPYSDRPYSQKNEKIENKIDKVDKKKQKENELLIAKLHFTNWANATAKIFEGK
jgi:hypothetical protein